LKALIEIKWLDERNESLDKMRLYVVIHSRCLVPIAIGTKHNDSKFLNTLYLFEERRNITPQRVYVLSFACAKERTKEKHTGNDIQPLPGALIKLLYYC